MNQDATKKYDLTQSYRWNYEHAPAFEESLPIPETPRLGGRDWSFCGLPTASPLGVAAGPLLNGHWVLHYARMGLDVLTYKTVRSRYRECYPQPNLQPIQPRELRAAEEVDATSEVGQSWAISFGMPSMEPDVWRRDVAWTRRWLPQGKILSVSVVASAEPGWHLEQVAADYAKCALWATDSGADCIELNFSCPNVTSVDGQLYQDPEAVQFVLSVVRAAIPKTPLILKIGHVASAQQAVDFLEVVDGRVQALAMTNCIACRVRTPDGFLFDGQPRGIGGEAIREASVRQVRLFAEQKRASGADVALIGVGGVATADHVQRYLAEGAEAVHLATSVMRDPEVGWTIRQAWEEPPASND